MRAALREFGLAMDDRPSDGDLRAYQTLPLHPRELMQYANRGHAMSITIAALLLALWTTASADPNGVSGAQAGVAALLARSANAWNRGDLDAFMKSYEDSPQTVYIGAKTIVHGYAAIRAHYAGHYTAGKMGMLSVSDLAVRALGPDFAVASARWHLARPPNAGGNVSGLFTLVLHRTNDGWHIITDHTP